MVGAPRLNVAAPSFAPLPYGLLSSLWDQVRRPDDPHWTSGVTWESVCAQGGTTYDECWAVTGTGQAAGAPSSKASTTSITRRGALPFTVYAEVDCSAPGFWDRAQDFVTDALTQSEQWQVENAIWTGMAGGQPVVHPHLANNTNLADPGNGSITLETAATVVTGGTLDVVEGLGTLEKALADCYDGVGVIHASRDLIPAMRHSNLIIPDGPRYRTAGGNLIIFGAGYRGTSPAGVAATGQSWMYATGAMFIYRGPVQIVPIQSSFDRAENTVKALAERTYLVGWDCCQLAVNISAGGVASGTAGAA